jgi:hypothetical protein
MKVISNGGASVLASRSLQTATTAQGNKRIVPREHLTIARHFNAGFLCKLRRVPEERPTSGHWFNRPFGTCPTINLLPALKRRAVFGKSLWDCVLFTAIFIMFPAMGARAETTNTLSDAEIQGRQLAQQLCEARPAENVTGVLKIRDAKGKYTEILVKFAVIITETNWASIFEGIDTNLASGEKLRIIHQESQSSQYAVVHVCRSGETFSNLDVWGVQALSEEERTMPFANSDFWLCDLGLEFFHWPAQKVLPKTTNLKRGREYTLLESTNPNPSTNGYSRVLSCIDKETGGILEAEAYDIKGELLKVFEPKSFKKVNGQWQLQEMEIRNVQTGSRTRLEFVLKK